MPLIIDRVERTFQNPISGDLKSTTFVENWQVLFTRASLESASPDDLGTAEFIAYFANKVPQIKQNHRLNANAFCQAKQTITIVSKNRPTGVIVTCTFNTQGTDKQDEEENPLLKIPDVTWSSITEREAVINARRIKILKNNNPIETIVGAINVNLPFRNINSFDLAILNSFGDVFAQQPEKEVAYQTVTIVENVPFFSVGLAKAALFAVNGQPFSVDGESIASETAMCINRSAQNRFAGILRYREQTTTLLFKPTHDILVTDNGANAYIGEDNKSNKYRSGIDEGGKITINGENTIKRLDGKGNVLDDKEDSVFLQFAVNPVLDFNLLNLPRQRL